MITTSLKDAMIVWSRDEVTGVSLKYSRSFLPSFNNGLVGRFPSQALQMLGKVEGAHESEHMRSQALQVRVVKRFDGSVLDGPVHPFGLPVCPRVVGLGQFVDDAVFIANPAKDMHS
jgi:hypothetical protein